jgi:putative oxidoreductase
VVPRAGDAVRPRRCAVSGRQGTVTGMNTSSSRASHDGAALLLRLAIGPMLIAHGYNKVFGQGGLTGTTRWFDSLGLRPAHVHARMAASTEIGAGTLITLGAASPLPAAAAIGLMATAARTDHKGKGFFVFKGGWEYTAVVAAVATVMAALGPGRYSFDGLIGRVRSGMRWGWIAALIGIASSTALIAATYRPEEKPADQDLGD